MLTFPCLQKTVTKILTAIAAIVLAAAVSSAQNTQTSKNKADQNLKSSARVNPSTLAMEFSLPLGNYSGRNGQSTPFAFSYSSKVWNLQFYQVRAERVDHPAGMPWYNKILYYNTEVIASFSGGISSGSLPTSTYLNPPVSGWTSNFGVPMLHTGPVLYNGAGGLFETSQSGGGMSVTGGCALVNSYTEHDITCESLWASVEEYYCRIDDRMERVRACLPGTTPGGGVPPPGPGTGGPDPSGGTQGTLTVYRYTVAFPDGTTKEFRKDDRVRNCALNECGESYDGTYLSVDGSGMRLEKGEVQPDSQIRDVLYMPDGTRYIFPETDPAPTYEVEIDRQGNVSRFDPVNQKWVDNVGREFGDPLRASVPQDGTPGVYPFTLNGMNGEPVTYQAEWRALGVSLEDSNTNLKYLGRDKCNTLHANPISGEYLFENQESNPLDDQIVNNMRTIKTQRVCAEAYGYSDDTPENSILLYWRL